MAVGNAESVLLATIAVAKTRELCSISYRRKHLPIVYWRCRNNLKLCLRYLWHPPGDLALGKRQFLNGILHMHGVQQQLLYGR